MPCTVSVVEAPPDVRAEIEVWVGAEPRCDRELEVRVVPAKDGFDLSARDASGDVRRRSVPDATSVAVLVVAWMAADGDAAPGIGTIPPIAMSVPPPPARPERDDELPAMQVPHVNLGNVHALTMGLLAGEHLGARAQIDLFARRSWALGVAGSWRDGGQDMDERGGRGNVNAFVAGRISLGPVSLRAQVGAGVDIGTQRMRHGDVLPAFEGGVLVDVPIGMGIGIVAGPVVDVPIGTDPSIAAFIGARYGL